MSCVGVSVVTEQVDLVSVGGRLGQDGIDMLRARLEGLLGAGCRRLAVDLSGITECDSRLLNLMGRIAAELEGRDGRLHVLALGPPVLEALDHAALPEILRLYRASRRLDDGAHA